MAKKILVVDDDNYIRDIYEEVLKDAGHDVETASDGEDALSKLKNGGYDLVLLDVMMPKKDGLAVLSELKDNPPATPNNKIVLLTNLAQDPIVKDALSKGAESYIIKTDITPGDLLDHVKKYLQ